MVEGLGAMSQESFPIGLCLQNCSSARSKAPDACLASRPPDTIEHATQEKHRRPTQSSSITTCIEWSTQQAWNNNQHRHALRRTIWTEQLAFSFLLHQQKIEFELPS